MPQFSYRAKSRDGRTVEGVVDAPDRRGALAAVSRQGLFPITVTQGGAPAKASAKKSAKKTEKKAAAPKRAAAKAKHKAKAPRHKAGAGAFTLQRPNHMSAHERLNFTSELADLLEGGMTLGNALTALARRGDDGTGRSQVILTLRDTIVGGESFSDALARFPKIFSPIYVNMVRAGEASGAMIDVLRRLIAYDERMRSMMTGSVQFSPPVCAVSAPPTFIITSMLSSRCSSDLISSNEMNLTSKGAPERASMTPA